MMRDPNEIEKFGRGMQDLGKGMMACGCLIMVIPLGIFMCLALLALVIG